MDWTATQVLEDSQAAPSTKADAEFFTENACALMRQLEQIIAHVAPTDFPLLLAGESGVGKEAVALYIHRRSRHFDRPFTKIVCGALTPEQFDALQIDTEDDKNGGITSSSGTLFLDEITDLTPAFQAFILHAIPDGEAASVKRCLRARLISSTSKSPEELEQILDSGTFRRDLFYRLNGVGLRLPPLRERREDLPGLAEFLLRKYALRLGRPRPSLSARALQVMQDYSWPGNIRELENVVKRIVAVGDDSAVAELGIVGTVSRYSLETRDRLSLKEAARAASRQVEKDMILKVLTRTHWNRKRAAQHLQISYKALLNKLRQMGLDESGTL